MATFLSFKKVELSGMSKDEALSKAPFFIQGDATPAFRRWKETYEGPINEAAIRQFMLNYLEKKSKNAPGTGFVITLDPAVADTRERPYKINDRVSHGRRRYAKTYQLFDKEGKLLGEMRGTQAKAKDLAKQLIMDGFHGKGVCTYTQQVVEGEPVAFEFEYVPSKGTKPGTWLVFGIEA